MTNAKIETLQDRFVNGTLDTSLWEDGTDANGMAFAQTPVFSYGEMTCPGATGQYSGISSANRYDLTESGLSAELIYVDPTATATFALVDSTGATVLLWANTPSGVLEFSIASGTAVATIPFVPAEHRFWRICEAGGNFYADVSPDGIEWVNIGSAANSTIDATGVKVMLDCGGTTVAPVAVQWGNIGYVPVSSRLVDSGFTTRPLAPT
jgi:hypothetical protein